MPQTKLWKVFNPEGTPQVFCINTLFNMIASTEGTRASNGGVAYDYILKPAETSLTRPTSPPKERYVSHDDIYSKLKKAEERRQVLIC